MKIAIMQPYFFPYIGYFQLISAVDEFILFDDVQYIKKGWINRNRILSPDIKKEFLYIVAPLQKHSHNELIKNIKISYSHDWISKIYGQLTYYKKIRAPFYKQIIDLLEIIFNEKIESIVQLNLKSLNILVKYLGIKTELTVSSEYKFDYSLVQAPGDWAFEIAKQKKAKMYINPFSGRDLFNKEKFHKNAIELKFLKPKEIIYKQSKRNFVPWLSIIDVMMFNSKDEIRKMLNEYELL